MWMLSGVGVETWKAGGFIIKFSSVKAADSHRFLKGIFYFDLTFLAS